MVNLRWREQLTAERHSFPLFSYGQLKERFNAIVIEKYKIKFENWLHTNDEHITAKMCKLLLRFETEKSCLGLYDTDHQFSLQYTDRCMGKNVVKWDKIYRVIREFCIKWYIVYTRHKRNYQNYIKVPQVNAENVKNTKGHFIMHFWKSQEILGINIPH